ncbi:T9SS type A sorting domain-containing protein [Aurantibacillus circumpalustris]|uniref:T9SS type A sorting domain-containing protein n=1 Tax=Aurantibacillus circumpalustris TaxID=3036359 RepID=UPI0037C11CC0
MKDLLGKRIYTNFINKNDKLYVPLTELNNGIYLLSLTKSNNEIIYRTKLIKQN